MLIQIQSLSLDSHVGLGPHIKSEPFSQKPSRARPFVTEVSLSVGLKIRPQQFQKLMVMIKMEISIALTTCKTCQSTSTLGCLTQLFLPKTSSNKEISMKIIMPQSILSKWTTKVIGSMRQLSEMVLNIFTSIYLVRTS